AAALQAKNLVVNSGAFTGTIPFTGLTVGTSYRVYLVGQNAALELTPTPEAVNPAFEHGTTFFTTSYYVWPKVAASPNGNLYMLYWDNANARYTINKWSEAASSWGSYTSFTSANTGTYALMWGGYDGADFRASSPDASTDYIHMAFGAGATVMANTKDPYYGLYNGSSWTFTNTYNDLDGPDDFDIFIDAGGKAHITYEVGAGASGYLMRYETNAGGSFLNPATAIQTNSSASSLEIGESFVVRESGGTVHIFYGSEQDPWHMGYYMADSSDNFVAKTLVLDSCTVASCGSAFDEPNRIYLDMGNVIIDAADKIHLVYTDTTNGRAYYRTNKSGSWVTTELTTAGRSSLVAYDLKIIDSTVYIAMGSNAGYYLKAYDGTTWYDGNLFYLDGYLRQFEINPVTERVMIAAEVSANPYKANYTTGMIADFVTVAAPNTAPTLGGSFTTAGTVNDNATIAPFSGVTVADAEGNNVSVAITYTAANGTLTGTGLTGSAGSYTLTAAAPATVTTNLQGLVFHPTANQVIQGNTVVTSFTLTPNDGTVNGSANSTTQVTATSINDAPVNTVVPAISGTSTVGSLLSATSGTWTDADSDTLTFTYQWYRADDNTGTNEAAISGATAGSYTLTASDTHKYLRVIVTANDGHGSSNQTATSTRTAVTNSAPVNTVVPAISGTSTVGSLLSATSGTWSDDDGDTLTYTYQWYRADDNTGTNEAAISGATNTTYTLTTSDAHKYLRVVVTANDAHGSSDQTATSTRTVVSNTAPVNTVVPAISGTSTVG
ncbi:MAG: hypothetical protein Q8R42_03870, partial [Desulfocapsaceae bacterium]|nr:hypothetical protein [Desulfocapsaceae bacterium]